MASAAKPMTAVQKILAHASGRTHVAVGEVVEPVPELTTMHDGFVETAHAELSALGYKRITRPERLMILTDHDVLYTSERAIQRGRNNRRIAKEWNVGHFFDVGRGGHGHIYPIEAGYVRPGMFIFAYDMHCTNFGAVGALAIGVGAEFPTVLATGTLWTEVPETIRVELTGALRPGAHPRDVGFLLSKGFAQLAWGLDPDNRVVELAGNGLAGLDLAARVALCNTLTEIGAANVLFAAPPPGVAIPADTPDYLSDGDAAFAGIVTLDLGTIRPQVALPGGPERAADIASVAGRAIQHAYLGSCGSGMYEDFAQAAAFMKGHRVADHVRLVVVPGTNEVARRLASDGIAQVFLDAGAQLLPPGCGPCAGGAMAPLGPGETSIATAATNHAGRFGTKDADVFLGSPLTVAASAVAGQLTDPASVLDNCGARA
jgi:3-isopropylmalate/(R)-2-methylmalate dehydratase large subunit